MWAYWWWRHLPSPGYAIAVVALVAAVMSVHGEMRGPQKAIWLLLIGVFMIIEFRAIKEDRMATEEHQRLIEKEDRASFQKIVDKLDGVVDKLGAVIKELNTSATNQRNNFHATTHQMLDEQRQNSDQFSALISEQKTLFKNQEQLFDALSGRMVPASDPTPPNACSGNGKIREKIPT